MKRYQKVSVAGAIGIAAASMLVGMGSCNMSTDTPQTQAAKSKTAAPSDTNTKLQRCVTKAQQMSPTATALAGGLAFALTASLCKRARNFRLYAAASTIMLAIIPLNFVLDRNSGQESSPEKKQNLAQVRTLLGTLAASIALYAKGTI